MTSGLSLERCSAKKSLALGMGSYLARLMLEPKILLVGRKKKVHDGISKGSSHYWVVLGYHVSDMSSSHKNMSKKGYVMRRFHTLMRRLINDVPKWLPELRD